MYSSSAINSLHEVRGNLEQTLHDCLEGGIRSDKEGFDPVQRLMNVLDQLDAALSLLPAPSPTFAPSNHRNSHDAFLGAGALPKSAEGVVKVLAAADLAHIPDAGPETPSKSPNADTFRPGRRQTRQSVSFPDESPMASPKTVSPQDQADGQVQGWLNRTYSGYGSFRRQSKAAANDLLGVPTTALAFEGEGMPALDLSGASPRSAFSRPATRHIAVFADQSHLFDEVTSQLNYDVPELHEINDPTFDVLQLADEIGPDVTEEALHRRIYVVVVLNVFLKYSFITTFQFKVDRLVRFFESASKLFSNSPLHNALHAADILQGVHAYFCQTNVKENFSDVELFATLFSAAVCGLGQLGVSNEFLARIQHPLVRLFTDVCPAQTFSVGLALQLLSQPETAFTESPAWDEDPFNGLAFREMVSEIVMGTAPKYHLQHIADMEDVVRAGFCQDEDVPKLLASIVHLADCRYTMLPEFSYLRWVSRFCEENFRQGDAEASRGLQISDLCSRHGTTSKVKTQIAFLRHVVQPLVLAMKDVIPKEWANQLQANLDSHGNHTSPRNSFVLDSPNSMRSDDEIAPFTQGVWTDDSAPKLDLFLSQFKTSWGTIGGLSTDSVHVYAMARLLLTHMSEKSTLADFPGHVVALACKLNDQYIGDRSKLLLRTAVGPIPAKLQDLPFQSFESLANIIAREEIPNTFSLSEPRQGASLPFLVVLLRVYQELRNSYAGAELPREGSFMASGGGTAGAGTTPGQDRSGRVSATGDRERTNSSAASSTTGQTPSTGRWITPIQNSVYRRTN
jgi:hypothetical protein